MFVVRATTPRKALRGGISKINFQQVCQLLKTISHKMAPRTGQNGAGITPRRAFCGTYASARHCENAGKRRRRILFENTFNSKKSGNEVFTTRYFQYY